MFDINLIFRLTKLATKLDESGMFEEADEVDSIIENMTEQGAADQPAKVLPTIDLSKKLEVAQQKPVVLDPINIQISKKHPPSQVTDPINLDLNQKEPAAVTTDPVQLDVSQINRNHREK